MYYNYKKELIKNGIIIFFILMIAVVSTHYIYYKFNNLRSVDYNSESLDIVFHEKAGANVSITKVTPVTDSVGLSSNSYNFTITNNLTEPVKYDVKIVDDLETIKNDDCGEYLIGKENIKVAIKEGNKESKIYTLSELEEGIILSTKIKALDEVDYSVRIWIDKDSAIPAGSNLHYHGLIKVIEE